MVSTYGSQPHHTYSVWLTPKVMMEWKTRKCGETQDPRGWKHQGDCKRIRCVGMPAVHSDIYLCVLFCLKAPTNNTTAETGFLLLHHTRIVVGASLSEPHTSESNGGFFIYIYLPCVFRKCKLNSFNPKHCARRSVRAKYPK